MLRAVEAIIDEHGNVRLLEEIALPTSRRAIVTILEETPLIEEITLLSEAALSKDWNRPEEDEAWSHLGKFELIRGPNCYTKT